MRYTIFLGAMAVLLFAQCKKSDDSSATTASLNGSKWVVTYYWDKDKNETSDFANYSFDFESNGTLVASLPGGSTRSGTWSTYNDDSLPRLNIVISGTKQLDDITDDWVITEKTDDVMKLRDDNDTHVEEIYLKRI